MARMTREQWQRVKAIALEAWARPAAERSAYVAAACGADGVVLAEVESILASMADAGDRFDTPAVSLPGDGSLGEVVDLAPAAGASGRIGPWSVLERLGQGGMGTVYLAERRDHGFTQRAAVKLVRGGYADSELQRRLVEERRILATLEHPDIARLIDGGTTDDGVPYVVMELVDGLPIDAYCDRHQLGLRQRVELFRRVCAAVHYAHQRLVVHRDLKAANILVTADGVPKLLDFGIAKLLDSSAADTHTLARMVTPDSASPEQIRGETITTASDIYALGVLLYRLLSGSSPYGTCKSQTDLIRAVCEMTPPPPSAAGRGSVPSDLDLIVMKALRKEPDRRYGSAEQLSDDLQRWLDDRPVRAAPDSAGYRVRTFARRHRLGVAAAAVVVTTLVAGIAATLWQARVAQLERERADAQRGRAERQFGAVRGLANAILGELHDAIAPLPGSTRAREILLRRATEYLDTLSAEAGNDADLQRELGTGYRRLGQVQGVHGMSNLGDREAARRNYQRAASMLEALGGASSPHLDDRIWLADIYITLAGLEADEAPKRQHLDRARAAAEGIAPFEQQSVTARSLLANVWWATAQQHIRDKDYASAEPELVKAVEAGESALGLAPDDIDASRNLSIYYKNFGAILEMLGRRDTAFTVYDKALALDRARLERDPSRALWKLDLSFAHGAIGSALSSQGEYRRALAQYDAAVALREEAVASDPEEDFARLSLARGYDRQAGLRGRLGDVAGALERQIRRLAIYERRLEEHPERENVWREYAQAAFGAAGASLDLLEQAPSPGAPRQGARQVQGILDDLVRTRSRWAAERRSGTLGPSDEDLETAMARCRKLLN